MLDTELPDGTLMQISGEAAPSMITYEGQVNPEMLPFLIRVGCTILRPFVKVLGHGRNRT